MENEEIIKKATALYQEAFDSNCYYLMLEQYKKADEKYPGVLGHFPAFYNLTYNALMVSCFMGIAKLYDNSTGALSIGYLLKACDDNQSIFPEYRKIEEIEIDGEKYKFEIPYHHTLKPEEEIFFKEDVELQRRIYSLFTDEDVSCKPVQKEFKFGELLNLYKKRFCSLSKKQKNSRVQRNKIYAHCDGEIQTDEEILKNNPLTFQDMKEMITFALDVTRMVLGILTDIYEPDKYSNMDDFEWLVKYAKIGMDKICEEVDY